MKFTIRKQEKQEKENAPLRKPSEISGPGRLRFVIYFSPRDTRKLTIAPIVARMMVLVMSPEWMLAKMESKVLLQCLQSYRDDYPVSTWFEGSSSSSSSFGTAVWLTAVMTLRATARYPAIVTIAAAK